MKLYISAPSLKLLPVTTFIEEEPPISIWTDWWEKSEVEDKVQVIAVVNEEDPKVVDVSGLRLWKWKNEVEFSIVLHEPR